MKMADNPKPAVPVERIRSFDIPEEFKPALIENARYVLDHPKKFGAAAQIINDELKGKNREHPPAFWLTYMVPDAARETPPTGKRYRAWANRFMLLVTLATYPGDLSHFGSCGKIAWDNDVITGKFSKKKPRESLHAFRFGREWTLFDDGELRDEMKDKDREHIAHLYGVLLHGKKQNVVKTTPWHNRGVLGQLADKLVPILGELGIKLPVEPTEQAKGGGGVEPVLDETDVNILKALATYSLAVQLFDIAMKAERDRDICAERVKLLIEHGYAVWKYPKTKTNRPPVSITGKGQAYLAKLKAA
jgi:hypothetical protein